MRRLTIDDGNHELYHIQRAYDLCDKHAEHIDDLFRQIDILELLKAIHENHPDCKHERELQHKREIGQTVTA